jgi:hypothetical protein
MVLTELRKPLSALFGLIEKQYRPLYDSGTLSYRHLSDRLATPQVDRMASLSSRERVCRLGGIVDGGGGGDKRKNVTETDNGPKNIIGSNFLYTIIHLSPFALVM